MTLRTKSLFIFSFFLIVIFSLLFSLSYLIRTFENYYGGGIPGRMGYTLTVYSIIISVSVIVFILFLFIFSRMRVLRPLNKLEESARRYNTENRIFPLPNIKNDEIGSLSLSISTMIKTIERQKEKMARDEKLAALGLLAAGMAHEINNPIGYILSNCRTMEEYLEKIGETLNLIREQKKETKDYFDKIGIDFLMEDAADMIRDNKEGIKKIHEIVKGINGLSRQDQPMDFSPVDLKELTEEALKNSGIQSGKNPKIIREEGEIPPVDANRARLFQLLMNLFINAHYVLPEKGGIIRTNAWKDSGRIFYSVEDNGPGIKESEKSKIFEPFYTTKPSGEGVGLGLNIAYQTMKSFNGDISVDISEWGGAKFILEFPERKNS